ncbi:hypothetical protein [Agrobacterium arsenijevicii]|uniref:hypothetical protein n=1 Tax=Agrobacterium arsenijevicii TaxID=1585697 RepID=UPI000B1AACA7
MANIDTGNGPQATPQDEASPPKRGLMSGLKAMVKRVSNTWSRSSQTISPPHAEYTPPAPPVADQSQNVSKPQAETKRQHPVAEPIKLEYADKIPQAYVPHEENQERLRGQLRGKMQTLDEQLAARKEAAALAKVKEIRPSGEIIYKGTPSLSPGDTTYPGKRPPPPQSRTPSVDAGVPPLPSQTAQALSARSVRANEIRKVDIPPSKKSESPRLSRTPSASTISSTASSVFSSTSKSSAGTSASSIDNVASRSSPAGVSYVSQAFSARSVKAAEIRKVDIPPSVRPEDVRIRPSTELSRAGNHENTRSELNERSRTRETSR